MHVSSESPGTFMMVMTGPNTSSWAIFMSAVTPASTWKKKKRRRTDVYN